MQNIDIYLVTTSLIIFCFILLALIIILMISVNNLKKRLNTSLIGPETGKNLEKVLADYHEYVSVVDYNYNTIRQDIDSLYDRLKPCIQKVGIVRYNPFEDMGGDLSYAVAILDQEDNGLVINTIMTRDSSRTYCKPVNNCKSKYPLSYEEELSIKKASGQEETQRGTKKKN